MDSTFDAAEFVKDIGILLVHAYDGARKATTPGLVGSAIEQPVRRLLSSVLPRGLSVGTGCVVDSYGRTSRQMDVVLYERDICPVFRVNDTPAYPSKVQFGRKDRFKCHTFQDLGSEPGPYLPSRFKTCVP